jgi:dipeptidyl aminopeptidase/acylaminoacyl peptidase
LAVNAEAREKVFDWIIETFPQFSIFTSQNIDEDNPVELTAFNINYVPRGFELVDRNEGRTKLIYNYSTKNDQKLTIIFSLSSEGKSYYDTENAEIEEFVFKGSRAYIWQTSEITYLIWYQDGIECHISGNISKDEIIKVAENILK